MLVRSTQIGDLIGSHAVRDATAAAFISATKARDEILMPPMKVPGGPRIAQFADPAGNRVGLVEG
jgi:predicted enzyme related to lactoylglutathione lyase